MKKSLILCAGLLAGSWGFAQSVSPEVIATAGDHFIGTSAQMSWTLGEPVTETFAAGTFQLTQGFHQTKLTITAIVDLDTDLQVNIFPNPTAGWVNIELPGSQATFQLQLTDVNGRVLATDTQVSLNRQIDLSRYALGTYFLQISRDDQEIIKTYQIIKQN